MTLLTAGQLAATHPIHLGLVVLAVRSAADSLQGRRCIALLLELAGWLAQRDCMSAGASSDVLLLLCSVGGM